jgi:hypothetical protein
MRGKNLAGCLLAPALFLYMMPIAAAASPAGPDPSDAIPDIRVPGAFFQPLAGEQRTGATLQDIVRASARLTAAERHDLGPLSAPEVVRLQAREPGDRQRVKIGIVRTPVTAVALSGFPSGLAAGTERSHSGGIARREPDGRLSWTTAFVSPGAGAVRLHFTEAQLPPGSRVYVYSERGEVHGPYAFDSGLRAEGFWTNSVAGEQIYLEVQFSGAADAQPCRLVISDVAHRASPAAASLAPESVAAPQSTSCFKDEACMTSADFGPIDSVSHAVAALDLIDAGFEIGCSGGLIRALGDATTPYLLTANHCFDNQAAATSLQATFNFKDSTCNQQPFPNEKTFPSTLGSTLLATGAGPTMSDFTLVHLSQSPPSGAFLLGWSTQDVSRADGTKLYRLSHPAPTSFPPPWPQYFSRAGVVAAPISICDNGHGSNYDVGTYLYSTQDLGGTAEGSSGSPTMLGDGSVVGQLFGKCPRTIPTDPCNAASFYQIDGAFRTTYSLVSQWLSPQRSAGTLLCLGNGRFCITADWQTSTGSGSGTAVQLTSDTGYFWFFDSANVEMVVKVLNGCSINNGYWVFAGGLTNVLVRVTITDMQTGAVRTYFNPQSTAFQPIQDTSAFSTCP